MIRPIVLDLDQVLYDFARGIAMRVKQKFSRDIHPEQVTMAALRGGLTGNELIDRDAINALKEPQFYYDLKPLPGVHQALLDLQRAYTLIVVTSRPETAEQITRLALDRDFPGVRFERVFVTRKKADVAKAARARIAITHGATTADTYAALHIRTYLITGPGVEHRRARCIIPVSSFPEAVGLITALSQEEEVA